MADSDTTQTGQTPEDIASLETLEGPADASNNGVTVQPDSGVWATTGVSPTSGPSAATPQPERKSRFRWPFRRFNVYLLLFGIVVLIGTTIVLVAYLQSRRASSTNNVQTQSLSQSTLEQLANGDATVGSNQSILNVQSSAIFAGQVLLRHDLQVVGNLQIGGTLALNSITVSGVSQLGQATVNKSLAVSGDTVIQGATTIAKSLQVNGGGTFGEPLSAPQLTTSNLQLNGDLVLTHHISIGGSTPSRSGGPAIGSGGSVSLSGSDTAGSIGVNTGSGPAAGCFVTINFTAKYNATPHVLITPIGASAGGLSYYVNRTTSNFSVCVATPPPAGASFGFDYFVID